MIERLFKKIHSLRSERSASGRHVSMGCNDYERQSYCPFPQFVLQLNAALARQSHIRYDTAHPVFLPGDEREAYLAAEPKDDARFIAAFAHSLEHAGGYKPDEARRVAGTLLPDILSYDPARPVAYPSNGRALTDDVVDFFLPLLTGGKITDDKVGPHSDLLAEFPYVGPPHTS